MPLFPNLGSNLSAIGDALNPFSGDTFVDALQGTDSDWLQAIGAVGEVVEDVVDTAADILPSVVPGNAGAIIPWVGATNVIGNVLGGIGGGGSGGGTSYQPPTQTGQSSYGTCPPVAPDMEAKCKANDASILLEAREASKKRAQLISSVNMKYNIALKEMESRMCKKRSRKSKKTCVKPKKRVKTCILKKKPCGCKKPKPCGCS
jgi:hypothetical protein